MKRIETTVPVLAATVAAFESGSKSPLASLVHNCPWGGFAGGLDHLACACDGWGLRVVDRGLSKGSGVQDGSALFCVPVCDRVGTPPVRRYWWWS